MEHTYPSLGNILLVHIMHADHGVMWNAITGFVAAESRLARYANVDQRNFRGTAFN